MFRLPISGILVIVLVLGVVAILTGLHNIDNAWNIAYIQTNFGLVLNDSNAIGHTFNASALYNLGVILVMSGMFISVLSGFELGRRYAK